MTPLVCTLCGNRTIPTKEKTLSFCCKGCEVVYQILHAQGSLANFQEHPVYNQAVKAGLIANPNPDFLKKEENIPEEDFQKLHLFIQNMWCPSCAQVIHLILLKEKGIRKCVVDYATDLALIEYTPRLISQEKILKLIRLLSYEPLFLTDPRKKESSTALFLRFIVAAFFSLNVMMFAYPIYATYFDAGDGEEYAKLFAWLSFAGALPVLFYSGWPIWTRVYNGLKVGVWGMEALVFMGVTAATGLSLYELFQDSPYVYFDSVTVIILFVLLGKIMESRAKFSAKDALVHLSLALPQKGRKRFLSGEEHFVPIKEIIPGDFLAIRMGEKIVLDGRVVEGSGASDESLMTGESFLVSKEKGASVLAGTVLVQGSLLVQVTSSLKETALQQIINMVTEEIEHKSKYVRASDMIVRWFVPAVFLFACFVGLYCLYFNIADSGYTGLQTAILRMVAIFLISCPCAIGIAAPLAESGILNALAKLGILVRNRGSLPFLGKETVFILDKTGTVTEGRFVVREGLENLSLETQQVLKGLTAHSNHPIAVAIQGALAVSPLVFEKVEEKVAQGLFGVVGEEDYYLGSAPFLKNYGIIVPLKSHEQRDAIYTTVYFGKKGKYLTSIVLGDSLRDGIQEFIQGLSPMRVILVSGDAEDPVSQVARACHISEWKSGFHPLQKKEFIDRLKEDGHIVAMIGDGMNDAPSLTAAHVGIAVFSASEMSIQVSDLLLTKNDFKSLLCVREIALKGEKVMRQNLFWAFFYNCIGLIIAAFGWMTPLFAAFAMVISSLIVLLNAQRISFKPNLASLNHA